MRDLSYWKIIVFLFMLYVASKDVTNWWLAYWVSTFRYHDNNHMNISAFNLTPTHSHLGYASYRFPAFNITGSGSNKYFFIGIYLGLAAANSVSPWLSVLHQPITTSPSCLMTTVCPHLCTVLLPRLSRLDLSFSLFLHSSSSPLLPLVRCSLCFEPSCLPMGVFVPQPFYTRSCFTVCLEHQFLSLTPIQ